MREDNIKKFIDQLWEKSRKCPIIEPQCIEWLADLIYIIAQLKNEARQDEVVIDPSYVEPFRFKKDADFKPKRKVVREGKKKRGRPRKNP